MTDSTTSYWLASTSDHRTPPSELPRQVDVVVIGGGIAGITTAYLASKAGCRVALVEARELASGVTGNTTAKITVQHGAIYSRLTQSFSSDAAKLYAQSQTAALQWLSDEINALNVDCDFSRQENYLYTEQRSSVTTLRREVSAATNTGLPAQYTDSCALPYPIDGAVCLSEQAQFHPRRWLLALAQQLRRYSSSVHTGIQVTSLTEGTPHVVHTNHGDIAADHVVVTTHSPIFDRGAYFAALEPRRDLVVAARIPRDQALTGMYLDIDTGHSVRTTPADHEHDLLIIGGEGHLIDSGDTVAQRFQRLSAWARERFGISTIDYRWMAHDLSTPDGIPYIGAYRHHSNSLWVATGFSHWGMSNGTLSGMILSDLITGKNNPYTQLYSPQRTITARAALSLAKINARVAARFVNDRLMAVLQKRLAEIPNGHGRVTTVGMRAVAAYRNSDGQICALSARCTHLGCLVAFNDGARTWDCPCHGSRFALDGSVIQGPAVKPLPPLDFGNP